MREWNEKKRRDGFRDRDEFLRAFSPKMRGKKWYEWRVQRMDEFDVDDFFFPNYEWIEGSNGWVEKLKEENAEEERK